IPVFWHVVRKRPRNATAAFFRSVTRYRDGGNGFDALDGAHREAILGHGADVAAELRSAGTGEALTRQRLAAVGRPPTLVLGARSSPFFARVGRTLATAMPQLRTVVVPRAGHLMMLEEPRAFADAISAADTAPPSSPAA